MTLIEELIIFAADNSITDTTIIMIVKPVSPKVQGCYVPIAIGDEIKLIVEARAENGEP